MLRGCVDCLTDPHFSHFLRGDDGRGRREVAGGGRPITSAWSLGLLLLALVARIFGSIK